MTKADIVAKISEKLGLEKGDVQATVETFMEEVKNSLETGDNVYLRGFGSFIIKTRAEKTGRNISKNTTIKIPASNIARPSSMKRNPCYAVSPAPTFGPSSYLAPQFPTGSSLRLMRGTTIKPSCLSPKNCQ